MSKKGATVDVLELTTKPRYVVYLCSTKAELIIMIVCIQLQYEPCRVYCCFFFVSIYSLLDPAVELDADSVLRKTYSVGEEVTGVIWQVYVCSMSY